MAGGRGHCPRAGIQLRLPERRVAVGASAPRNTALFGNGALQRESSWGEVVRVAIAQNGASWVALWQRSCLPTQKMQVQLWVGKTPREGDAKPPQYSSWRIPWTEEPGGLWSMGQERAGHD